MSDDADLGVGLAAQALRKLVQDRPQVWLDVGLARVERNVTRNIQLELIVGRLRYRHASAGSSLFHRSLLLGHLRRPDVATQRADTSAHRRSAPAVANGGARQGTQTATNGGTALRVTHVGAAADQHGDGAKTNTDGAAM